jgi:hypothetical protein
MCDDSMNNVSSDLSTCGREIKLEALFSLLSGWLPHRRFLPVLAPTPTRHVPHARASAPPGQPCWETCEHPCPNLADDPRSFLPVLIEVVVVLHPDAMERLQVFLLKACGSFLGPKYPSWCFGCRSRCRVGVAGDASIWPCLSVVQAMNLYSTVKT